MMVTPSFPKYLSIQSTSVCNASCIFCPYKDVKYDFPPKIMGMDLYKRIIDECRDHKTVERIILYMNNEPLTDNYLIERIDYAKEKVPWANVHILTNGLLLTEKNAERLINSKLDWIGISFHGIRKETIESAMGIPFEVALERINNFIALASKKKDIKDYIMVTFLKHQCLSEEERQEAIDYWKTRGIQRISCFEGPISRAGNVKDLPKVYNKEKIIGCNSIWADEMIHIVEDGKVVLCCMDWKREVILGDLYRDSIYKVWNGRRKEVWKIIHGEKDMPDEFLCRRCEEAQKSTVKETELETISKINEDLILVMTPPWQTKMVPLGLAYLSSFLRSQGFSVKVTDLNVKLFNSCQDSKRFLWDISTLNSFTPFQLAEKFIQEFYMELEEFIIEVCRSSARFIGFSTTIASVGVAVYLARQIKSKDASKIIVLGGPGCYWDTLSLDTERLIDIFVIGEGELPLSEIMKRFKKSNSLSSLSGIEGTVICMNGKCETSLPPRHIKKIDEIPPPDFSEFNIEEYNKGDAYKPLPLLMSRGCINRCSFCVDHKMSYPFRVRDPIKVVEEIKFHRRQHGVIDFEFTDLLCNGNLRQLEKICDLIIEENLDIRWTSYAAVREGMSLELCRKMRKAGCRYLCYGMESASEVVLKKMNKRYNAQLAEEAVRNTHKAGIFTAINIIIGHPGESEKEFRKTCDFVLRNKEYIGQVTNVSSCFLMLETDLVNNLDRFGVYFKKSLRDRLDYIIKGKAFVPNYREYCVFPDDTPYTRARWLRRFLKLLYKNRITYVIVNYTKEHNKNLDKFIERQKRREESKRNSKVLEYKNFKLDLSNNGQCKLYFKDEELTSDVGINTSFFVEGRWVDSSSAQWDIKSCRGLLDVNIQWSGFPITQQWRIGFRRNFIDWEAKTCFHSRVRIFQRKTGMMLSRRYSKYMFNGTTSNFTNDLTGNWEEFVFSKLSEIRFCRDGVFPIILFRPLFRKRQFLQLQNSPLLARMVNVCYLENSHIDGYNESGIEYNKGDILKSRIKIYLKT